MKEKKIDKETASQLLEFYHTPDHVIRHCMMVAQVSSGLAAALNQHGFQLSEELILGAAMVHDIARVEDFHEEVGAALLEEMGYPEEAAIVRKHMHHDVSPDIGTIQEIDLVCLGDRMVKEDQFVGLDVRMEYILKKWEGNPRAEAIIRQKVQNQKQLIRDIEEKTGLTLEEILERKGKNPMNYQKKIESLLNKVEKPGRYIGGELNSVMKDPSSVHTRFGFAFPDTYEIGMSFLGLQILYGAMNQEDGIYCERIFAPVADMESAMRMEGIPLLTIETKTPVRELDFLGFTLQYEMSFTNILNMLDLGNIHLFSRERSEEDPFVVAGGPCAFNPEPLADFIDIFMIGDGEELIVELCRRHGAWKTTGVSKMEFLKSLCDLPGIYIPSFYTPVYREEGTLEKIEKNWEGAPYPIEKSIVPRLEEAFFPEKTIVPFIEVVHDRSVVETFRGCTRGCRFCQAGMIYRPVRERSKEKIENLAKELLMNSGHEELTLLSLSTSDYSQFEELAMDLMGMCKEKNVSLSLPSLRLDNSSFRVLQEIQGYKKSGLTFAPEAGSQRLRDVINKNITEEDIYGSVEKALELGWNSIKLYFMIGLPTETLEDLDGIVEIARRIVDLNYQIRGRRGGRFNVTISVSNFVPKAHTPFQWFPQNTGEEFMEKHFYLKDRLKGIRGVTFNYHHAETSLVEAVLARGDRKLSALLLEAWRLGCRFDGWSEHFKYALWQKAFDHTGLSMEFYASRPRKYEEVLPWDHIDSAVTKEYLIGENEAALKGTLTPDCRLGCTACGVNQKVMCEMEGTHV